MCEHLSLQNYSQGDYFKGLLRENGGGTVKTLDAKLRCFFVFFFFLN